jgi:hypothetical protein
LGAALSVSLNVPLGNTFGETPKAACETQALPEPTETSSQERNLRPLYRVTRWKQRKSEPLIPKRSNFEECGWEDVASRV